MRRALRLSLLTLLAVGCRANPRDPSVGTVELVFEAEPDAAGAPTPLPDAARERLAARVQAFDLPAEVTADGRRITVALRGDTPVGTIDRLKQVLPVVARLEIREVADDVLEKLAEPTSLRASFIRATGRPPLLVTATREDAEAAVRTLAPRIPAGTALALQRPLRDRAPWNVLLLGPVAASNEDVRDARASVEAGLPAVVVKLKRGAAERFEAVSRRNVHRRLAITLDGAVLAAPYVVAPIPNGDVHITLGASGAPDEANTIALVMRAGAALPVRLRLVEERRIAPAR